MIRAADEMETVRVDSTLSTGVHAVYGTDLATGLARHTGEQRDILLAFTKELDGFGARIRAVASAYRCTDDTNAYKVKNADRI